MLTDPHQDEELVEKCIEIMREEKKASTSLFQRRLRIGYTRASHILGILEQRGYVGPADGAKPRQILVDLDEQPPAPAPAPETPAAPAPAEPPSSPQTISITPVAKPENPIDRITDVVLYRGADGFVALVIGKGIVIRGKLTFEEWREAHYGLFKFREVAVIGLADSVNYARKAYGDRLVDEALQQMEFPFIEAKKAGLVDPARLPWQTRENKLKEEHFFVAGGADLKPEDAAKWLEIAVEQELSPVELKRSIEVGKVIHNEDTPAGKGKNSGIVTIYAVRALYLQWKRSNYTPLLAGPIKEQQDVLTELEPICELIDKLRANIAAREAK